LGATRNAGRLVITGIPSRPAWSWTFTPCAARNWRCSPCAAPTTNRGGARPAPRPPRLFAPLLTHTCRWIDRRRFEMLERYATARAKWSLGRRTGWPVARRIQTFFSLPGRGLRIDETPVLSTPLRRGRSQTALAKLERFEAFAAECVFWRFRVGAKGIDQVFRYDTLPYRWSKRTWLGRTLARSGPRRFSHPCNSSRFACRWTSGEQDTCTNNITGRTLCFSQFPISAIPTFVWLAPFYCSSSRGTGVVPGCGGTILARLAIHPACAPERIREDPGRAIGLVRTVETGRTVLMPWRTCGRAIMRLPSRHKVSPMRRAGDVTVGSQQIVNVGLKVAAVHQDVSVVDSAPAIDLALPG